MRTATRQPYDNDAALVFAVVEGRDGGAASPQNPRHIQRATLVTEEEEATTTTTTMSACLDLMAEPAFQFFGLKLLLFGTFVFSATILGVLLVAINHLERCIIMQV